MRATFVLHLSLSGVEETEVSIWIYPNTFWEINYIGGFGGRMDEEYGHSFFKRPAFRRDSPAKGYWVIGVRIIDEVKYFLFLEMAVDAIDRLGGRMVIRSPDVTVGTGSPKPRLIVVEFSSLEQAKAAFGDVAQQTAMMVYDGIAEYDLAIVEGYDDFG